MSTPDTLNLAEAADYLKLGYVSTKELFEAGELPGVSLNQKHTVFLRVDLERYLHETARKQAAERRALPIVKRNETHSTKIRSRPHPDLSKYD